MFDGTWSFNQPLARWDVSHVADMSSMFEGVSSFNQPLSALNVSQVIYVNKLFDGASSFNQAFSPWNVSRVTNMYVVMKLVDYCFTILGFHNDVLLPYTGTDA